MNSDKSPANLYLSATVTVAAVIACGMAFWLYSQPLTGVNGSVGALLTLIGAASVLLAGLILILASVTGAVRIVLLVLLSLAALLTGLAGWFLLSPTIAIAMAVALLAALALFFTPPREVHS